MTDKKYLCILNNYKKYKKIIRYVRKLIRLQYGCLLFLSKSDIDDAFNYWIIRLDYGVIVDRPKFMRFKND